jgi:GT2 family glycosyltransferase
MTLSILIATVPRRKQLLAGLLTKLETQANDEVQIIALYDNRHWTVGTKRNKLLSMVDSTYFSFVDDDDDVSDDYIEEVLAATKSRPDLITFNVRYTNDKGEDYISRYDEGQRPAHVHVWKSGVLNDFPERNAGEDIRWVKDNLSKVTERVHIDKTLYHYKFNSKTTEAQSGFTETRS